MFKKVLARIHESEKRWSASYGADISTAAGRRQAWWHFHLSDHGFLRVLWTNLYEIAPGVWRSNQPSPARLARYHRMGIRTILNLRGAEPYSYYLFEREAAARLGIEIVDFKIHARTLAKPETYIRLLDLLERMPRPFLMHCKSGADRAGLAAALWLIHVGKRPVEQAIRQLSFRFAHLKHTRTGLLDELLLAYARANRERPIALRDWFASGYDRAEVNAAFARRRQRR
jgi:protein tyrosine phosphatase (PTP) superfamily phosphohydrolase (DUF442 family)